jgi:L-alanine-DL-glutamate epimerase-like enolase superfamily enzyme
VARRDGGDTDRGGCGTVTVDLFDVERGLLVDAEAPFLDLPLHDLAARILGVPVHRMIGGAGPKSLPVYSGAVYFEDLEERRVKGVPAVVAACAQDHAAGYRAFKLKMGRGAKWMEAKAGLKRDIDVVRAVRERFPDCRVLVDANNG